MYDKCSECKSVKCARWFIDSAWQHQSSAASLLLGRSFSRACSGPSGCTAQASVDSSPPAAKSSSWLWRSCRAPRWCRCWGHAPADSCRSSSWLSSPLQHAAASWGSKGAGWSLGPDRKCSSSRLAPRSDLHPGYLNLGTTSTAAAMCSGGRSWPFWCDCWIAGGWNLLS